MVRRGSWGVQEWRSRCRPPGAHRGIQPKLSKPGAANAAPRVNRWPKIGQAAADLPIRPIRFIIRGSGRFMLLPVGKGTGFA